MKLHELAKQLKTTPAALIEKLAKVVPNATATTTLSQSQIDRAKALYQSQAAAPQSPAATPTGTIEFQPASAQEIEMRQAQIRLGKLKELAMVRLEQQNFQADLESTLETYIENYVLNGWTPNGPEVDVDLCLLVVTLGERRIAANQNQPISQIRPDADGNFHLPASTRQALLNGLRQTRLIVEQPAVESHSAQSSHALSAG